MKKTLARFMLRANGWRIEGSRPDLRRCVVIAAPHTSNWDFFLMLMFAAAFDMKVKWMGKHSLFRPPMGWIMQAFGGMPIFRHKSTNLVNSVVETFSELPDLMLVVPTEGTRGRAEYWKSGFYHIALKAGVPIVPSFLDFGEKRGGFGPAYRPTGNIPMDMQYFRDFYAGMRGKFPQNFGPIRLREELDNPNQS